MILVKDCNVKKIKILVKDTKFLMKLF